MLKFLEMSELSFVLSIYLICLQIRGIPMQVKTFRMLCIFLKTNYFLNNQHLED
jgi:hypothetical protein